MKQFNVHAVGGVHTVAATCDEMARLEIEDAGLGPVLDVVPVEEDVS